MIPGIHVPCPGCDGYGRTAPDWALCTRCDGIGHVFADGAPSFGCETLLSHRNEGEIVELANGQRGRIRRHDESFGNPTTVVALIGDFDGVEDESGIHFPASTGVVSVDPDTMRFTEKRKRTKKKDPDILDPMRKP